MYRQVRLYPDERYDEIDLIIFSFVNSYVLVLVPSKFYFVNFPENDPNVNVEQLNFEDITFTSLLTILFIMKKLKL